jgi:hypothetical protein
MFLQKLTAIKMEGKGADFEQNMLLVQRVAIKKEKSNRYLRIFLE